MKIQVSQPELPAEEVYGRKKTILLVGLIFVCFVLQNCGRQMSLSVHNTSWKLVAYHDHKTGSVEIEPTAIKRSIQINFDEISKWNGHTPSNKISGSFEISENNEIRIVDFRGTKMGEPHWGRLFWESFPSVTTYKLEKKKLILFYDEGKKYLEFVKVK